MSFEDKASPIKQFLEENFGTGTAIATKKCSACGNVAVQFRDAKSAREFEISGLCQLCQDQVFGDSDD